VDAIAAACLPAGGIVEVGPGPGVLTQRLVAQAPVVAIDLDRRAGEALKESAPEAEFLCADILRVDLAAVLSELPEPRCLVSNLPYYITAAVVDLVCTTSRLIDRSVLLMQEEVAQKLMAPAGSSARGSLSVEVQYRFEVSTVCKVPPGAFLPPPKVHSRALFLVNKRAPAPPERLFDFVRKAFKQPKKTLANNLVAAGLAKRDAEAAIAGLGLDPMVRPHLLSELDWVRMASRVRIPRH
jgi:16S rRNA (adenine1518-N6/adenine1519-N6)-dimethyltransferase